MEVSGQLQALLLSLQRKEPSVSVGEVAGWASEVVWTLWSREKNFDTAGNGTTAVHPILLDRHYAD
jgi:hypothetical protein